MSTPANKPPEWLGDHGKSKFKEIAEVLGNGGPVPPEACEPLVFYCEAYDDFRTALQEIKEQGTTCFSEKGGAYLHPAVGRKNKAIARMKQLGPVLGWAETKVATPQKGGGVSARKRK